MRALCKADLEEESGRIHNNTLLLTPIQPQPARSSLGHTTPQGGEILSVCVTVTVHIRIGLIGPGGFQEPCLSR